MPKITPALNQFLLSSVHEVEIREAVFDLGDLKAPGIDGLNGMFFQKKLGYCQG